MKPEQREELKKAAQRLYEADESNDTISAKVYATMTEAFFERVTPAAILSLIAQVEALTVEREKLLNIIASAYQIAGAHDASELVLDVLSDPLAATDAQIEALLPYQVEALTVPQWISVDKKMPRYIETVLITNGAVVKTGSLDADTTGAPCWFERFTVTHWMPLPAAPTIPAIPGTKEGA